MVVPTVVAAGSVRAQVLVGEPDRVRGWAVGRPAASAVSAPRELKARVAVASPRVVPLGPAVAAEWVVVAWAADVAEETTTTSTTRPPI